MTMIPQCSGCIHLREPLESGRMPCSAFPEGIPIPILLNEHDHHKPYKGDHGILFEPIEESEPEQYAANPCGDASGGFQRGNDCAAGSASDFKTIAESKGYGYHQKTIGGKTRHVLTKDGSQQMLSDEAMKAFAALNADEASEAKPTPVGSVSSSDSVLDAIHELKIEKYPHTKLIPLSEIAREAGVKSEEAKSLVAKLYKAGEIQVTFGKNDEMLVDPSKMKPRTRGMQQVDTKKLTDKVGEVFQSLKSDHKSGLIPIPAIREKIRESLGDESARHDVLDSIIKGMVKNGQFRIVPVNDATDLSATQLNAGIPGSQETWYYLESRHPEKFERFRQKFLRRK